MAAQQTCQRRCEHEKSIQKWKRNKIKTRGNESATEAKRRLKPRLRWWRWRWWSLGAEQVFKTCYKGVFKNLLISTPSPDGSPFFLPVRGKCKFAVVSGQLKMELEKELQSAWELGVAARLLMKREVQKMYLYLLLHKKKYLTIRFTLFRLYQKTLYICFILSHIDYVFK